MLLNLLASIGNKRDDFAVADLDDLDYATRLTAVWAIGIAAGAWSDYSTSPYPYRIQGVHR